MQAEQLNDLIPPEFAGNSRVWVYQAAELLMVDKEEGEINEQLHQFYAHWQSHGTPVRGWAKLLFRQFIIVMADENDFTVSGCSTDSSVRVIISIERQYDVNFFDRMMLTFLVNGKVVLLPFNQVQYAVDIGLYKRRHSCI